MKRTLRGACCACTEEACGLSFGEVGMLRLDEDVFDFPMTASEVRSHLLLREDIYRLLRAYAREIAAVAKNDAPDVVRLLDLDALWNADGALFDPSDRRYLGCVLDATDALLQQDVIFEARLSSSKKGRAPILYPPLLALRRIGERRGRVMLSREANTPEPSDITLRDAAAMLRACGIGCVYTWENKEWKSVPL